MHRCTVAWMEKLFPVLAFGILLIFGTAGWAQSFENCILLENEFSEPQTDLTELEFGPIKVTSALDSGGVPVPFNLSGCSDLGRLGIEIPWSQGGGIALAAVEFATAACSSATVPLEVAMTILISSTCALNAYDSQGNLVSSAVFESGPAQVDMVVSSASRIQRIEIEGENLCISQICWNCDSIVIPPTPTPLPITDCTRASDVFGSPTSIVSVNTDIYSIQALSQIIQITDCGGDGDLDFLINQSFASPAPGVDLTFSAGDCGPERPYSVEIEFSHTGECTFEAYDSLNVLVDTVQAATGTQVQTVTLTHSSGGIGRIRVNSSEMCLIDVCIDCSPIPPTPPVSPDPVCYSPGTAIVQPISATPSLTLTGTMTLSGAVDSLGSTIDLAALDCSGDGRNELVIPDSPPDALAAARIEFATPFCMGDLPERIELTLSHDETLVLNAFDATGTLVASTTSTLAGVEQPLGLNHEAGIAAIEFIGSAICISQICRECSYTAPPTPTPTPLTAGSTGCLIVGNVLSATVVAAASVDLGFLVFHQAVNPQATPIPLSVDECSSDEKLDILISDSPSAATNKAYLDLTQLCEGFGPARVELALSSPGLVTLRGYDLADALVAVATADQPSVTSPLLLHSPAAMVRIEFEGVDICVSEICWDCYDFFTPDPSTPTPTITPIPLSCEFPEGILLDEAFGLSEIDFGDALLSQAVRLEGTPEGMNVVDCLNSGRLGVYLGWTKAEALARVSLLIDEDLCVHHPPQAVDVTIMHSSACVIHGFDQFGANVVSVTAESNSEVQTLFLEHADGLARIEFEGENICFLGYCLTCTKDGLPTPTFTPTNTFTETPTFTPTETFTETFTPTPTPTFTETFTPTETFTETPTPTETFTEEPTPTETFSQTPSETPTETATETPTETATETPTATRTATPTPTFPSDYDFNDNGKIDVYDLLEVLRRIDSGELTDDFLFQFMLYWARIE